MNLHVRNLYSHSKQMMEIAGRPLERAAVFASTTSQADGPGVFPYTFTGCMPRCNVRTNFNTNPFYSGGPLLDVHFKA